MTRDVTTACSSTAEFTNGFGPATAAAHKITQPAGSESGWAMTLTAGPGGVTETVDTDASGDASFTTALEEGDYTITEATRPVGRRSAPAASARSRSTTRRTPTATFSCTFTNRRPAHAAAVKITQPAGSEAGWTVTLNGPGRRRGRRGLQTDANGNVAFTTDLQSGGHYTITRDQPVRLGRADADRSLRLHGRLPGGRRPDVHVHVHERAARARRGC